MNDVKKLDALTSLRFFAAAMIVIGHSHPLFGSLGIATHYSLSQGVSFFFTLSGFILAYNYKSLPDFQSAKRFLVNRFARIWPLHFVTMLIWIALITPSMTHEFANTNDGIHKLILNLFLIQSWSFTAPNVLSFNGVAWSISTEAFFYVTLCFILMNKKVNMPFAIIIFSFVAYSFIFISTKAGISNDDGGPGITMFGALYANPLVRIIEFLFGVLCFSIYQSLSKRLDQIPSIIWFAIEILMFALIIRLLQEVAAPTKIYNSWGPGAAYYVYKEGIWLFWGALIIIFSKSTGLISKLLSFRPIVFLGEASFALYLCHAIIINMAYKYPNFFKSFGAFDALAFWAICIASASALHIFVENPCRKLIVGKFGRKSKPVEVAGGRV
ncbi:acyltransferase family protein [Pantoea sp. KPR_PJ]|uniref:acyltransferase family protein n=1 Tax=Pantoea sp. KPR_PJ TaxID=2738375 RepID=UPI003527D03D